MRRALALLVFVLPALARADAVAPPAGKDDVEVVIGLENTADHPQPTFARPAAPPAPSSPPPAEPTPVRSAIPAEQPAATSTAPADPAQVADVPPALLYGGGCLLVALLAGLALRRR